MGWSSTTSNLGLPWVLSSNASIGVSRAIMEKLLGRVIDAEFPIEPHLVLRQKRVSPPCLLSREISTQRYKLTLGCNLLLPVSM